MANYVLEILDGDRAGEVLPVPDRALRIGRKPTNDVVLADEKTSGVHAEIVLEGDRHVLRDLGSTNGTFLDGKRVTEVVLTSGDVVTVGRLRVGFRDESDASAAGSDGDFAVHRLDAGRVQKRGGSIALLGVLLLVGGGVGGYLWWSGRDTGEGRGGAVTTQKTAMVVSGNKLSQAVAACEDDSVWNLAAHGIGWQPTGSGNSGKGALEAVRVEDDATDFAIATPAESVTVPSGRSLAIAAHVRTDGAALVGVRAVFSNSKSEAQGHQALHFRTGSKLEASPDWQRVEVQVAVPPGCDRLDVEIVAVLPDADAAAYVDDVAVTESGNTRPLEHRMDEGPQTVIGTGAALATRSTEVTLLGIAPGTVEPALTQLHAADLCVLSDVGATLEATPKSRSVTIAVTGHPDLQFEFPVDSAGGTLAREVADGPFAAVAAESEYSAVEVLLGGQRTRALVRSENAVQHAGRIGGGLYRLRVGAPSVDLVLGFRAQWQVAQGLLRDAKAADADGEPGRALDLLQKLQREAPQDSEVLHEAVTMGAQIVARLEDAIRELQSEFGEAEFFNTRGGFERVVRGVDRLVGLYGDNNLQGRPVAAQLRNDATARLLALDTEKEEALRARFGALSEAFTEAGQPGLAKLVQDYVKRNLGGN